MNPLRTWKLYRLRVRLAKVQAKDTLDRSTIVTTRYTAIEMSRNTTRIKKIKAEIEWLERRQ